jgi:hypothetical protein
MLLAVERLPEGTEWLLTSQVAIARQGLGLRNGGTEAAELVARTDILSSLTWMGMASTNLARLIE